MAGPTNVEISNPLEFQDTALLKIERGTMRGSKALLDGIQNALAVPETNRQAYISRIGPSNAEFTARTTAATALSETADISTCLRL